MKASTQVMPLAFVISVTTQARAAPFAFSDALTIVCG